MSGDVHVRFCESLGVRFPGATHLGRITEQLAYVLADLGDRSAVDAKGLEY